MLRAEGLAEYTGDIFLLCTGGTPGAVAVMNVQVFVNTSVTSRLLKGGWSESLLFLDDPFPEAQKICGSGGCASGEAQNVFQGQVIGDRSVLWTNIPIDPPGEFNYRILRITNLRVDATQFGNPGGVPPIVVAFVSLSGSQTIPLPNEQLAVGFVGPQLFATVTAPAALSACDAQNPGLAADPAAEGVAQFNVEIGEMMPGAFQTRTMAQFAGPDVSPDPIDQAYLGMPPMSESRFVNLAFPKLDRRGDLATAGLADHGTRVFVRFRNVPAGVRLFVPATVALTSGPDPTGVLRMVKTEENGSGPFSPVAANANGLAEMPLAAGSAMAVYEVLQSFPFGFDSASIPVYVAYAAGAPAPAPVQYEAGFAPFSNLDTAKKNAPVPRFLKPRTALGTAFTIEGCAAQ